MNLRIALNLVLIFAFSLMFRNSFAQDYDHSLAIEDMEFHWKVSGSNLSVKVSAKTRGWVGVGFNPEKQMQGADFILGYVKGTQVEVTDDYGVRTTSHTDDEVRNGKNSIVSYSGSEIRGVTTLEFVIPLNSGEKTDTVIDPKGKTILLLSYGARDSFRIGHKYYAILEVNLTTGDFKEIRNR